MDEGMRVKEGENTMGNYTREEVLQMAEDEDVEFIRLQFTDMFGTLKNIAITARELPRALDNEYVVDSSYIAGIAGEKEPDMYLHPDYNTFTILPWRPQQGKVARLLCDIYAPRYRDRTLAFVRAAAVRPGRRSDSRGLNRQMISDYIRYLGNLRWTSLGYPALYPGFESEPESMEWVSQYADANMVKTRCGCRWSSWPRRG